MTIWKGDGWHDSQRKPNLLSASRYAAENRDGATKIEIVAHTRDGDEPIHTQSMREGLMDLASHRG